LSKYYHFRKYLYDIGLSESRIEETFNAISKLHMSYCALDIVNLSLLNKVGISKLIEKFAELENLNNNFNIK
jgi:hypothetical protein